MFNFNLSVKIYRSIGEDEFWLYIFSKHLIVFNFLLNTVSSIAIDRLVAISVDIIDYFSPIYNRIVWHTL